MKRACQQIHNKIETNFT